MTGGDWIQTVGTAAGVAMPLFNIPLIFKLVRRKSAKDFSLPWVLGVWSCSLLMVPQALRSPDIAFRLFAVVNITLFSVVTFFILKYHSR